ncbi:unnamed protein product [Plutella xylostella]|uniref:(diamondback moth) hypothetical protein n=1 Tax=Plutella xylostella TaxID=51655 RepID=A0A8S4EYI1_PLUXY|nr:unnamed protein product [Plutella xylostella]
MTSAPIIIPRRPLPERREAARRRLAPSPAPSSPAPTSKLFRPTDLEFNPPPLKESAGEAIYIYDDRQY